MPGMPTIAWFGATGGCAFAALRLAVKDGYSCSALVRDESKLARMLAESGIEASSYPNLTIITGDLLDRSAIRRTLSPGDKIVDMIVSGVGGKMIFTTCPPAATLDNPTICEISTRNIFAALHNLLDGNSTEHRPYFICVSTTGINQPHARDVPVAMLPLYHLVLHVPHEDKRKMEAIFAEELRDKYGKSVINGYLLVRPSLLTDGEASQIERIRVGSDVKPAVGYTISRNDVGLWIYETAIKGGKLHTGGNVVTITY